MKPMNTKFQPEKIFAIFFAMLLLVSCGGGGRSAAPLVPPPAPISRVSVDSFGTEATGGPSQRPSVSADGRYVAFDSSATNLVTGDANGVRDIFLHDMAMGSTTRVSIDSAGVEADNNNFSPSISADGRYVAFHSFATNLVTGDTNGFTDIFLHDTVTGSTTRVSVDSSGAQAIGGNSFNPSVSADGRYVAFESDATNLVPSDTNGFTDIFLHDTVTGSTMRVSVDSTGLEATGGVSVSASINSNGRYVAFESLANNLVAVDTNGTHDIFLHDTSTGTTTRVSVDSAGLETTGGASVSASINADGRYVAFHSFATNLVTGDTNISPDVFVHDTTTGTTTRVSVDSTGAEAIGGSSFNPSVSADGRYIAFKSFANNLVAGDTNNTPDIFVHDTTTGTTTRVSVNSSGVEANVLGNSSNPSVSADGRYVAFDSFATNLVSGDTNALVDVFRAPNQ